MHAACMHHRPTDTDMLACIRVNEEMHVCNMHARHSNLSSEHMSHSPGHGLERKVMLLPQRQQQREVWQQVRQEGGGLVIVHE